jgi:hypothetical protein
MQKVFENNNINIQMFAQDIENSLKDEGWQTTLTQNGPNDYIIRGTKKAGHIHHKVEEIIVRIRGDPNNVIVVVEEENIGAFGRMWINAKLLGEMERKVKDGFYSI